MINGVTPYPVNFSGLGIKEKIKNTTHYLQEKKKDLGDRFYSSSKDKPEVLVIDLFSEDGKYYDIANLTHGKFMHNTLQTLGPNIKITDIEGGNNINDLAEELDKIAKRINKGEEIKAINISIGNQYMSFETIRYLAMVGANPENIHLYKEEIKENLFNFKYLSWRDIDKEIIEKLSQLEKEIESLESIAKNGVKIFIAAGNGGSNMLQPLTLADGVIPVGALDKKGEIASYSAKNSLIKKYEPGMLSKKIAKKLFKKEESKALKFLSSKIPGFLEDEFQGTSFASVVALNKYLKDPKFLEEKDPHCIY